MIDGLIGVQARGAAPDDANGAARSRAASRTRRGDHGRHGLGADFISDVDNPWIPLTPLTDEVFVKYWKVDPVRSALIVSIKISGPAQLQTFQNTGLVVAHTISGVWHCKESNWIARAGDTLYGIAGSARTLESFEDTEIFVYLLGDLLFLGGEKSIQWRENPATSIQRYQRFCADNGIPARDLTIPQALTDIGSDSKRSVTGRDSP